MMYSCTPAARGGSSATVKKRGRSLTVDIHCHYLNTAVAAKVAPLNPAQHEAMAVYSNAASREVNAKQAQERGPKLTEIAVQHPERFVALGTVPLQDVSLAVAELEHCVRKLGLRGVEINPSVRGMDLTDAKLNLEAFFAAVQKLDVVIFMHPIGFTHGERLVNHYFNNVIGNPLESTVAASHLIFDGVLERHPKLKVVLPHAGGYLAHYWARMDHAYKARPDTHGEMKRKPSSYLEKFYFDSITFDHGMLAHLIARFGADHVLLGTDYPSDMGVVQPVEFIAGVKGLSKAEAAAIQGGNAARLLKIDYNAAQRRRS